MNSVIIDVENQNYYVIGANVDELPHFNNGTLTYEFYMDPESLNTEKFINKLKFSWTKNGVSYICVFKNISKKLIQICESDDQVKISIKN